MELKDALSIEFRNQQGTVRQRLRQHRVLQYQARVAAQDRNRVDPSRRVRAAVVVDQRSVGGPTDGGQYSLISVPGEDGPVARLGLHDRDLVQTIDHGLKGEEGTGGGHAGSLA